MSLVRLSIREARLTASEMTVPSMRCLSPIVPIISEPVLMPMPMPIGSRPDARARR